MDSKTQFPTKHVLVYSTVGKGVVEFDTQAATWLDLKKNLREMQVKFDGMKAVIGENRHTLESDQATLPDGDFSLFLMPIKVKSGAYTRAELFERIKALVASNPDMKQKFIVDGKNMTQLSTDKLNELWAKHGEKGGVISAPAPTAKDTVKEQKQAVSSVVESIKGKTSIDLVTALNKLHKDLNEIITDYPVKVPTSELVEWNKHLEAVLKNAETKPKQKSEPPVPMVDPEEERRKEEKRLAEEAEKKRKDELDKKARDMAREFKDIGSF